MADLTIKKGDTAPPITFTCLDPATGSALNLTGATVTFVMRSATATAPLVNASATIVSAGAGTVSYTFTATDTSIAGVFFADFHITFGTGGTYTSGTKLTCPTDGYLEVLVEEDTITQAPISRLVQLGEVKDHLNIPSNNRGQDAELLRFVDAVTPVVENLCGSIIQRVYQDERYDGGYSFISLRHRPVVEVNRVVEYRGPIAYELTQVPTPDLGTIYSYQFEPPGRIVRRTVGGGSTPFPGGPNSVTVTYTAGRADVPANIKLGTLELIRVNWQQTQQGGRPTWGGGPSASDDYTGLQMMGFFVPNRVRELLAPQRRHPSIA